MKRTKKINNNSSKGRRPKSVMRSIIFVLIVALLFTFLPAYDGRAANNSLIMTTPGKPDKQEVVYGRLSANGTIEQIYIVNHYTLEDDTEFTDYGDYKEVVQLTGEKAPILNGDKVSLEAEAGQYYYQGNLRSRELPWLIDISYELDGKEIDPDEVAGASGELLLTIETQKNPDTDSFFYDNYALQISASFDPDKAKIKKTNKGAMEAISGNSHLVNWIVFPGEKAELSILFDAKKFEMSAITFAGLRLDFDFDLLDIGDKADNIGELTDGINQLSDGAEELKSALGQLTNSYSELEAGGSALSDGGGDLTSGAGKLKGASKTLKTGMDEYTAGVSSLSSGMDSYVNGLGQMRSGVSQLSRNSKHLRKGSTEILNALENIDESLPSNAANFPDINFTDEDLKQLDQLVEGSQQTKDALHQLAAAGRDFNLLYKQMLFLRDSMLELERQAEKFPTPDTIAIQRSEAEWEAYLKFMGADLSKMLPKSKSILLRELSGISTMAAHYIPAVTMLKGTLAGLNNERAGLPAIVEAIEQLQTMFDSIKELSKGYDNIHLGIVSLVNEIKKLAAISGDAGSMIEGLNQLKQGMGILVREYKTFNSGLVEYTEGVDKLLPAFDGNNEQPGLLPAAQSIRNGLKQLDNNSGRLTSGLEQFTTGIADLEGGINEYVSGVSSFTGGVSKFREEGLDRYLSGFAEYVAGTSEFKDATGNLEEDVVKYIKDELENLSDPNFVPSSFASTKNTNVKSLQFVLMTEEISVDTDQESSFDFEDEGDFVSRLLDLFKINTDEEK